VEPIKEIKIIYPEIFQESLCKQLDYYRDKKINRIQKGIMKKLIENSDMQCEIFLTLLKIENVKIPETIPPTNVEPIALFLHYCIKIHEQSKQIKPLNEKDYQNCNYQISQDTKRLIKNIIRLKEAGAYNAESIKNPFMDSLHALALSSSEAAQNLPLYIHGNLGMKRKIKNYQHYYFITRLSLYTEELFQKPLYKVIAITANVVFDKDNLFDENNVKKKLFEFKKNIRFKSYDSG
jgi:hypothetical protein